MQWLSVQMLKIHTLHPVRICQMQIRACFNFGGLIEIPLDLENSLHCASVYKYNDIVKSGSNYFVCTENGTSGTISPSTTFSSTNPYQVLSDGVLHWNYTNRPPYNRGYKRPEEGGDEAMFAMGIDAGKAYVQGFEIEKRHEQYIEHKTGSIHP